ncbi:MAG TPA: HNH endonuclease signature motif containing protein [Pseudonocardiaceae bacterium]|nr:HNH endonuclease signature motif containing protein [Pseudonocardiaceae bacterium]
MDVHPVDPHDGLRSAWSPELVVWDPTGYRSQHTSATGECVTGEPLGAHRIPGNTIGDCGCPGGSDHVQRAATPGSAGCRCDCGRCRRGGGVDVRVTIPYTALLGADDIPDDLAGLVITRDQTCQFPGCRVPAHRCDIDHSVAYDPDTDTGPTSQTNLGPKCRRHHQIKQSPGWSVIHHPDGCTTWATPSGHLYHSQPPPLTNPEPLTHPAPDPNEPPPF